MSDTSASYLIIGDTRRGTGFHVLSFTRGRRTSPADAGVAVKTPSSIGTFAPSSEAADATIAAIVESVGGVLQAYAQHAFDTDLRSAEELRALIQQWRMHALIGSASPAPNADATSAGIPDRDWTGMVRSFGEVRRDEAAFVIRGQKNLRESIWAFVGALHHLVVEEHGDEQVAKEQILRVKIAVQGNDTEVLKREAVAAVTVLESLMSTRRARQHEQYTALADQLKGMGRELEDARRESCIDTLTGLPNRRDFDDYIRKSIKVHAITGRPACLLMIDVDTFKSINDTHGHPMGDEALRQVTRALSRTVLRKVDFVCRYGGDEFAIILQETDAAGGELMGDKVRYALRTVLDTPRANEQDLDYTLSVGVAELVLGDDAHAWTQRADQALYAAKSTGKNKVAVGVV